MKSIFLVTALFFPFTGFAAIGDNCPPPERYKIMKDQMAKLAEDFKFRSYTIPKSEWLAFEPEATRVRFPVSFVDENAELNIGFLHVDIVNCTQDGLAYEGAIKM